MRNHEDQEFIPESVGHQLGFEGVENVVAKVEAFCDFERQRIELSNQPQIIALQAEASFLLERERELSNRLAQAPPQGDLTARRRRTLIYWAVALILTISGYVFCVLAFDPFGLGWKSYLYCLGIAIVTPFCVEKLLTEWRSERLIKSLVAISCAAALASLVTLAVIRADLFAEQFKTDSPVVILDDDPAASTAKGNNFYENTIPLLRLVMVFLAFAGELAAGMAFYDALRLGSNSTEDFEKLRQELGDTRSQMVLRLHEMAALRNEAAVFVAQFWRDFYRAMLANTFRRALTKLLLIVCFVFITSGQAMAQEPLHLVIAVDLSKSVAQKASDGNTTFKENLDAVTQLLSRVPAGSHVTIIGITDNSFAQPYILLSATISTDEGYFKEKLAAARRKLAQAWKKRSAQVEPKFQQTDVIGALMVASQVFERAPHNSRRMLIIFSDMVQETKDLNLKNSAAVAAAQVIAGLKNKGLVADLNSVEVHAIGVEISGARATRWRGVREFWEQYFATCGANLKAYSVMRDSPELTSFSPVGGKTPYSSSRRSELLLRSCPVRRSENARVQFVSVRQVGQCFWMGLFPCGSGSLSSWTRNGLWLPQPSHLKT